MGVIAISTWGTRCEVRQLARWVPEAALGFLSLRLRVSGFLVFSFVSFFFFLPRRRTRARAVVRFRPASTLFLLIPSVHWHYTDHPSIHISCKSRRRRSLRPDARWRRRTFLHVYVRTSATEWGRWGRVTVSPIPARLSTPSTSSREVWRPIPAEKWPREREAKRPWPMDHCHHTHVRRRGYRACVRSTPQHRARTRI